jgi:hypothetical protein
MAFPSLDGGDSILFELRRYFQAISFKRKALKSIALSLKQEGNIVGNAHESANSWKLRRSNSYSLWFFSILLIWAIAHIYSHPNGGPICG